jgi:hypothetical protein
MSGSNGTTLRRSSRPNRNEHPGLAVTAQRDDEATERRLKKEAQKALQKNKKAAQNRAAKQQQAIVEMETEMSILDVQTKKGAARPKIPSNTFKPPIRMAPIAETSSVPEGELN